MDRRREPPPRASEWSSDRGERLDEALDRIAAEHDHAAGKHTEATRRDEQRPTARATAEAEAATPSVANRPPKSTPLRHEQNC